jgi:hypothetical protein
VVAGEVSDSVVVVFKGVVALPMGKGAVTLPAGKATVGASNKPRTSTQVFMLASAIVMFGGKWVGRSGGGGVVMSGW